MNDFYLKPLVLAACMLFSLGASAYYFAVDGICYNKVYGQGSEYEVEVTYNDAFGAEKYEGDMVIPGSVTYNGETYTVVGIGMNAFDGCTGLKSVVIPNSVTSIEPSAFYGCVNLSSVRLPNSITEIGESVFQHCSSLTDIEIPNTVEQIGYGAFYDCSSLTSVEIPGSVTSIGSMCFYGCDALTSVNIPNSVTSIGDGAFSGCKSLTDITVPGSVTEIEAGIFYGCGGLTAIELPNSVTSIGSMAFCNCYGLRSLVIPNSVVRIGGSAFDGCSGLKEVVCLMGTPVETDASFEDEVYESAVLYVPAGCKEKYEAVAPWSNFLTIKEIDAAGVSGVTVDDGRIVTVEDGVIKVNNADGMAVSVYAIDGTLVKSVKAMDGHAEMAVPGGGMYIVRVGGKTVKVAM